MKSSIISLVVNNVAAIEMRCDKAFVYGFRANMLYVPTCLMRIRTYVLSCFKLLRAYVLSFFKSLRVYMLTCLYLFFVPTCLKLFCSQVCSIFHVLTCLQPLRTSELTYIQMMLSLMKIDISVHQVLQEKDLLVCLKNSKNHWFR